MKLMYNKRPVPGAFDDFETVKARVQEEWTRMVRAQQAFFVRLCWTLFLEMMCCDYSDAARARAWVEIWWPTHW